MRKLLLTSVLLLATPALAAPWKVDPTTSKLTFEAEQSGEKFQGEFKTFTPVIDLDPAHPETGKISVTVDMASAVIDDKDRNEALPTDDWFAVKQFPTATFTSTAIRSSGANKAGIPNYEATGDLTIRGVTKPAKLNFALKVTGKTAWAKGELILNRSDYGIGQGQWKTDTYIKYPVTVTYEINASQ